MKGTTVAKGPRRRSPSKGSYHAKVMKNAHKSAKDPVPAASDVEVYDADGNLIRVERTKKPLTP